MRKIIITAMSLLMCLIVAGGIYIYMTPSNYSSESSLRCKYTYNDMYEGIYLDNQQIRVYLGGPESGYSDSVDITAFEYRFFMNWAKIIIERELKNESEKKMYEEGGYADQDKYITLQTLDNWNEKYVYLKPGHSLFAIVVFLSYYIRNIYLYIIPIWIGIIALFILSGRKKDETLTIAGRKTKYLTPCLALVLSYVALTFAIFLFYHIRCGVGWLMCQCNTDFTYNYEKWKYYINYFKTHSYAMLAVVSMVILVIANRKKPVRTLVAYIIPSGIIFVIICCFADIYNELYYMAFDIRNQDKVFTVLCRIADHIADRYLSRAVISHFLAYNCTILYVIAFSLYLLFGFIAHKPRRNLRLSLVFALIAASTLIFKVYIGTL